MPATTAALDTIEAKELRARLRSDQPPVLVNALDSEAYRAKRIPGSINIPQGESEMAEKVVPAKDQPIVVYCANRDCGASPTVGRELQEMGYSNVADFEAGLAGWRSEGFGLVGEEV